MNVTIEPGVLRGRVRAIASKSDVHRLLIAAALSREESCLPWENPSKDMWATLRCLAALGAEIRVEGGVCRIRAGKPPESAVLCCGESGSTLRFLLPVATALGVCSCFTGEGRLPERPQGPLLDALAANGCRVTGRRLPLRLEGGLRPGVFSLPGSVSSQFVSGLLFALPLLPGDSRIELSSPLESAPYVEMSLSTLARFGVTVEKTPGGYRVPGGQRYRSPGQLRPEGDWSNAAFWLCAGALGGEVTVENLRLSSAQGDRAVVQALEAMGAQVETGEDWVRVGGLGLRGVRQDLRQTPDLGPVLALTAAFARGESRLSGVQRLRMKESDRLEAVVQALQALGMEAKAGEDELELPGGGLEGGVCEGFGDHRMVMALAVAATACRGEVTILGAQAVDKSYPGFFRDFERLGGKIQWHP